MTFKELRKLLNEFGVEYYIKKEKGNIVKINVWVEEESEKNATDS